MGNTPLNSLNFNLSHGYLEGIVRGYKGGILSVVDYSNLTQCETIEGISMLYRYILRETNYYY